MGRIFNNVGNRPRGVVVAGGRLWIISHNHKRVFSIRLNGTSRRSIPIGWGATDIVADGDDVWVTFDIARKLVRINGRTREVEVDRPLDVPPRLVAPAPGGGAFVSVSDEADAPAILVRYDHDGNVLWEQPFEKGIGSLAWARGRVWVAEATRERVYPVTPDKTVERHLNVESEVEQLTYGDGRLWASTKDGDAVEYSTMNLRKFIFQEFRGSPAQIAVANGRVFIARKGLHRIAVVRLKGGKIVPDHEIRRRVPRNPYAVTFAAGHIWVTSFGEDSLARIDW